MRLQKTCFILFLILFTISSNSSAQIPELIGTIVSDTNATLFGYRIVPLGDQNNDGFDDFITWGFDGRAYLYYGCPDLDTINYLLRFDSVQSRFNSVGDLNNDGYDDILLGGRSLVDWKLNLFYGGPFVDTIRDLWFGSDTLKSSGYNTFSNDIDSDGNPEIFTWYSIHNSVVMFNLGSDSDSLPDLELYPANLGHDIGGYAAFGEALISGDFNGDGRDDLAVNLRQREVDSLNGQVYLYWGGVTFDTIPDMIITRSGEYQRGFNNFGRMLEYLGDVNNDGYDDFFTGSANAFEDTVHFIFFGGPNFDEIPDVTFIENITRARLAGDLNSDGYNDIITSYPLSLSGLGHINVYYGGPDIDSIPDITILNSDMSEWQQYFGNDCTGLGDVNGDGINDFAFSAVNAPGNGVVYIFSGTGPSTDINYNYEPNIPEEYILKQNYPNPFNPSTTIEFQIPQREHVTLSIYNTLGQKIRTLIDKELSVGSYTVEWDGSNSSGDKVSSGVYIYKLETSETTLSKKMLLLK